MIQALTSACPPSAELPAHPRTPKISRDTLLVVSALSTDCATSQDHSNVERSNCDTDGLDYLWPTYFRLCCTAPMHTMIHWPNNFFLRIFYVTVPAVVASNTATTTETQWYRYIICYISNFGFGGMIFTEALISLGRLFQTRTEPCLPPFPINNVSWIARIYFPLKAP